MNPLETYLKELTEIRSSGAGVKETSYYGPLAVLLNKIGRNGHRGAGHPVLGTLPTIPGDQLPGFRPNGVGLRRPTGEARNQPPSPK
jgi:hypothetical protein